MRAMRISHDSDQQDMSILQTTCSGICIWKNSNTSINEWFDEDDPTTREVNDKRQQPTGILFPFQGSTQPPMETNPSIGEA